MKKSLTALLAAALTLAFLPQPAGHSPKAAVDLVPALLAQTGHEGHAGNPVAAPKPAEKDPWAEFETKTVEVPVDRQRMIGVKTATAEVRPLSRHIRTIGRIEYDERRLTTINTKFEGWIEKLHVNATGELVKKGEPVADIYSPELYATQQEFLNVLQWSKKTEDANARHHNYYGGTSGIADMLTHDAEVMRDAARQRLRLWDISEAQIDRIAKTGKPIRTLSIVSPVGGYVLNKPALQGMRVMPGEKLLDIIDLSTVWVVADIYEYDLPFVKIGQKAAISLSYFPGKQFNSTLDFLYPTLAGETRTAKARFTIPNPGGLLKPQMYSDVELAIDLGEKLAVPEQAVINTGAKSVVYVAREEGSFEPREVTTGLRAEGFVEVTEGLSPGDKVAAAANFLLDSEARLKGVVQ
jgi:Cu(I)/Ag(I) efflux system membrane fusion protein